jgi:hypothetical protein
MSKLCLHCGQKLGFLKRTRDQFCSSEHSELYRQEQAKAAFQRLMTMGMPSQSGEEIAETPRTS